ncbi:DUF2283 domain-containing protein [Methyloradius palustris]|uniref:DUF2283 domain-containing protein n=1 Tax=Methyloradius palustris TaxID=2778876 RepID=A0A8D5GEC9_9PROT|nr:DUF2283 domain-containing protein [Methyloradius palustris]BCM25878.1 hypothetical protein ZMTM_21370 [Methyloradius palustris]
MKIKYFEDTDTLHIKFNDEAISVSINLDENMQIDLDGEGSVCKITLENASQRTDISEFAFEKIAD